MPHGPETSAGQWQVWPDCCESICREARFKICLHTKCTLCTGNIGLYNLHAYLVYVWFPSCPDYWSASGASFSLVP